MNLMLMIYLADIAGAITASSIILSGLLAIAFVVLVCVREDFKDRGKKPYSAFFPISADILASTFLLMAVITPSKKAIYAIAATQMSKEIAENPKVQELKDKALKVLSVKLDEMLTESN